MPADTDITILLKARDKASAIIKGSEKDLKRLIAVEKAHYRANKQIAAQRVAVEKAHVRANRMLAREAANTGQLSGQLKGLLPLLGAAGVAGGMMALVRAGVDFNRTLETATIQFGAFFDSAQEAEAHVRSLAQFAAATPFQMPGILEASRLLKTFEADAAFGSDTLRVLGDAAAGVNAPLENVALWVGRMNTALDAGRPVGEAATRLQELGLLSGKARVELETLAKAGGSTKDVMALLRVEWDKHNGAMLKLSETTAGLESTTGDLIGQFAGAALSGAKMDTAYKGVLATLNTFLRRSTEMIQGKSSVTTLTKKIEYQQKQLESWQKGMVNASDRNIPNFVARIGETTAEIIVLENAMKRLTDTTLADSAARVSWAQSRLAWAQQVNEAEAEQGIVFENTNRIMRASTKLTADTFSISHIQITDTIRRTTDDAVVMFEQMPIRMSAAMQRSGVKLSADTHTMMSDVGDQAAGGFIGAWQKNSGWSGLMDGASAALGAFATGGWQSGIMSMVQTAVTYLPPGFKEAAQIAIGMYTTLWNTFKNPSDAEVRARQDVDDYEAAAIEGLSESQIAEAMAAGWQSWEDAAFLIGIRDQYLAVGLSAEQAERDVQAYWDAMAAGDEAAVDAQQEAWDELGVSVAEVEAATEAATRAALAAWESIGRSAASAYDRAKKAGADAYDTVYAKAIESGAGQEEAALRATAAQIAATEEVLAAEGQKYARIAAFDAAMALGVNATAEERAEAARLAAAAAIESWDAAMVAVTESDAAANAAITGDAAVTSDVIVDESEAAGEGVGLVFEGMADDSWVAAGEIQAAFDSIKINIPINYTDNRPEPAAGVPGRAAGGPVEAMRPYLVGERGPEVVVPTRSGTVVPNDELGTAGVGGPINIRLELSRTSFTRAVLEDTGRVINVDGVL